MSIQSVKPQNEGLSVLWNDGSSDVFPWIWIRDHSESEKDLHPDSKQRQIDVFSNKLDNSIISAEIQKKSKNVIVKWKDNSESWISFDLLKSMISTSLPSAHALKNSEYWSSPNEINLFPEMSYSDFMSEGGLKKWLTFIEKSGFVLVTEAPVSPESTKELMERMAYVRNSIFGGFSVWDNKLESPDDTCLLYTSPSPRDGLLSRMPSSA